MRFFVANDDHKTILNLKFTARLHVNSDPLCICVFLAGNDFGYEDFALRYKTSEQRDDDYDRLCKELSFEISRRKTRDGLSDDQIQRNNF